MWKWKTVCQAAAPQEFRRLTPSARRRSLRASRKPLGGAGDRVQILGADAQQVGRVSAGNHERVPARRWGDVHEGDRALVFIDDRRRQIAREDPAEDAVVVGHAAQILCHAAAVQRAPPIG